MTGTENILRAAQGFIKIAEDCKKDDKCNQQFFNGMIFALEKIVVLAKGEIVVAMEVEA